MNGEDKNHDENDENIESAAENTEAGETAPIDAEAVRPEGENEGNEKNGKEKKRKKPKQKKTARQKTGVACMVAGAFCILYFIWINFYGIIYHEVYYFLYDRFWRDEIDEYTIMFDIGDMPDWLTLGSGLVPVNNSPVIDGEEEPETNPAETTANGNTEEVVDMNIKSNISGREKAPLVMPKVNSRDEYQSGYMRLSVPALGVSWSGVQNGVADADLGKGPGLYSMLYDGKGHKRGPSPLPSNDVGEDVNVVIAAHRDGTKANFYNVHQMKEGDKIFLFINNLCYTYEYEGHVIVEKSDWSGTLNRGYGAITLTTCHPIGDNSHRYIVFGRLVDVKEYAPLV